MLSLYSHQYIYALWRRSKWSVGGDSELCADVNIGGGENDLTDELGSFTIRACLARPQVR